MKGMESVLLAALVGLLGLGAWRMQGYLPTLRSAASSLTHSANKSTTANPANPSNSKPGEAAETGKAGRAHASRSAASTKVSAFSKLDGRTVVMVDWSAATFPNAPDLVTGTTRTELGKKYGAPLLKIAARRDGRLIEQYYYSSGDPGHLTVATLHDGRVIGAESVSR